MDISAFTQSQSHGLFWDNEIRERVFGLNNTCKNDTKKYDIDRHENRFDNQENVSIKVSGNGNIDCGDILRFFHGDFSNRYTIILLRYTQSETEKRIREIVEINYCAELRDLLFGTVSESIIEEYVRFVKSIPCGVIGQDVKKEYLDRKRDIQRTHGMRINICPKVDSRNQRRVQCSIPKIDELLRLYPQYIISRTDYPVLRQVNISGAIASLRRKRTTHTTTPTAILD